MATRLYQSTRPRLDLKALANTARKILDLLAYYSRMKGSSEQNHLVNKVLTKIITLIHMIEASVLAAHIGYQLATDAMILCGTEEQCRQFHTSLDSVRELSRNGQGMARFAMDGFRDIEQQIYKIVDSTKDSTFVVVISSDPSHTETLKIPMKDICANLVANLNFFTEFSRSLEAAAEWWNLVKADLENTNPTLLPFEKESGDVSENPLNWAEMQQGFQQYYNVVNLHGRPAWTERG